MADPFSSALAGLSFANPVGLVIGVILSTIVGGIVILIIVEIFAKKFSSGSISPKNAFIVALIVSLINIFGIMGLLGGFLAMVPFGSILLFALPVIVWFGLLKVFFGEMELLPLLIMSVVCYFVSIYVMPTLTGIVRGFIPL